MSSTARCVVFDLDDTLYLERDYVRSGFAAVGQSVRHRLGMEDFETVAWQAFETGRRGDIFDYTLRNLGVEPSRDLVDELVRHYRTHRPSIELEPDAALCLEGLESGFRIGLITDGPSASQRAKIEALDIAPIMDVVILTAELGDDLGKPHPRAFEEIEHRLTLSGSACIYVADNPAKDFVAPRSLGWRTVRVRRAEGLYSSLESGEDVDVECPILDIGAIAGGLER